MNDKSVDLMLNYSVLLDGKKLNSAHQVSAIQVIMHCDEESLATITINESSQTTDQIHFPSTIQPNSKIELELGYQDSVENVFNGNLVALEAQVSSGVGTVVILNAVCDIDYPACDTSDICLEYGQSLLGFNGVTHFENAVSGQSRFPAEVELTVQGQAGLKPNQNVTLKNCSHWFDGQYQILTVRHTIENGSWLSQLVVGR